MIKVSSSSAARLLNSNLRLVPNKDTHCGILSENLRSRAAGGGCSYVLSFWEPSCASEDGWAEVEKIDFLKSVRCGFGGEDGVSHSGSWCCVSAIGICCKE